METIRPDDSAPRRVPEGEDTALRRAIKTLHGPTQAAIMLGVSGTAIHRWLADGYMGSRGKEGRERVRLLAELTGEDPAALAGLR